MHVEAPPEREKIMAAKTPKKLSKAAPAKASKPKGPRDLPTIFSVKGTPAFNEWFTELSQHLRATRAGTFDRALAELAARADFRPPPIRLED